MISHRWRSIRSQVFAVGLAVAAVPPGLGAQVLGTQPDLAMGQNGLPLLAYLNDNRLLIAWCSDPDCASISAARDIDNLVGTPRIATRADGRPMIAYRGGSGGTLQAYDCADTDCSGGTIRPLDAVSATGINILVRDNGAPLIVYGDSNTAVRSMKVYDCDDANCSSGSAQIPPGQQGLTDGGTGATLTSDGLPVIASNALGVNGQNRMAVYGCADSGCTNGSVTYYEQSVSTRLAFSSDNRTLIAFAGTGAALRFLACADSACASGSPRGVLDSPVAVDMDLEVRVAGMPVTDLPVIAYSASNQLRLYDCENPSCSSGTAITLDSSNPFIRYPAMVIRDDGTPLIVYSSSPDLYVISCQDSGCSQATSQALAFNELFADGFEE
ncbi:MAG: hypothetical protein QNJ40_16120 [Xanthomonadales bacterium]|nr:hypothetical protein [Xanthomonadales bacterium]